MSKANIIKAVGTAVAVVLAGIAVTFPHYAQVAGMASTFILGALHIPQPGQS